MKKQFNLHWQYHRYFSAVKIKNMKALFNHLGIDLIHLEERREKRIIYVTFILEGTEGQYNELNKYMDMVRKVS